MTNKKDILVKRHEGFVFIVDYLGLSNQNIAEIMEIDDLDSEVEASLLLIQAVRDGKKKLPKDWFECLRDGLSQSIQMGFMEAETFNASGHPAFRKGLPSEDNWFMRLQLLFAMLNIDGDKPAYLIETKPEIADA